MQRAARAARVRDAARGGLRAGQAAGHGLRDDHRPRHDRRRARDRRPPRRVRLGGADRALPRRAPGRARPLLRHHARGPRVAAGPQRRRGAVRRLHARARDRLRARPPLLHRRRAADAPATAGAWPSCSASGRSATAPAPASSTGPPPPTSPRATASASAAATTTPASTSGAPTPKRRTRARPQEFLAHVRAGNVLARGAQGSAAKWAHAAIALAARSLGRGRPQEHAQRPDPSAGDDDGARLLREGDARHGAGGQRPDAPRTPAACCARGWARSSSTTSTSAG